MKAARKRDGLRAVRVSLIDRPNDVLLFFCLRSQQDFFREAETPLPLSRVYLFPRSSFQPTTIRSRKTELCQRLARLESLLSLFTATTPVRMPLTSHSHEVRSKRGCDGTKTRSPFQQPRIQRVFFLLRHRNSPPRG